MSRRGPLPRSVEAGGPHPGESAALKPPRVQVIPKARGQQKRDKVLRKIAAEADFLLRAQASLGVVQVRALPGPPRRRPSPAGA